MIVGNGDFINLSGDESKALMLQNVLSESTVSDVYKYANVPEGTYISRVEFDESTNTFTFTFNNGTKFTAKVNSSGEVDLSEYIKKDEVDSRIESIIGSAPEALDTLQELSKALGDDPNFATTVTGMISEVEKKTEEIKSSIPSIDGLATKEELTEATKDSVKYKEFTYTNSEEETSTRKTIQLDNYDTISGVTTDGTGVNLAMVSKWDIADFGSTSVSMNLNSKDGKVTINDDKEIAVKSDIPSIEGLAQTSYVVLQKDQAIETSKEYTDSKAKEIKGLIPSTDGLATESWVESKGFLTEHQDISDLATKSEVEEVKGSIKSYSPSSTVDISESGDVSVKINKRERHINISSDGGLQFSYSFKKVAPWHYQFLDKNNAQVSSIDSIDFNTEYDSLSEMVRARAFTVDLEKEVARATKKELKLEGQISDAISDNAAINMLTNRLSQLEDQVSNLKKTDIEAVAAESGNSVTVSDTSKDAIISGSIDTTSSITSKSVTLKDIKLTNDARLSLSTNKDGDIDIKSSSISGDFPKSNGNAVIKVNDANYVTIKDTVINASLYNCIEIGLDSNNLPSGVLIENCRFEGTFSNNAILIFGTKDNAVININNCYFENVSNCIRLSNKSNSKCTVNISNCKCDHWDTNPIWSGMLICQDYTSGTSEAESKNKLFAPDKITINISNFTTPSGKRLAAPDDMSTICGSSNENQVFYVWSEYSNTTPYGDGSKYPTINIL